jgi:acyl-CoA thioester hydrolase
METYRLDFEVRDNELDIQGIVNNANYFIYFAHARHKFIKEIGISFAKMAQEKQLLVLVSSNVEFKRPLKAEDKFYVTCKLVPEGTLRFAFQQEIRKVDDDILIATSLNIAACLDGNNRNRPYLPEIIKTHFNTTDVHNVESLNT